MENRERGHSPAPSLAGKRPLLFRLRRGGGALACAAAAVFCLLMLAACGAPGEPKAPRPPVPTAITDLAVHQQGDGVVLTFTVPTKTVEGARLKSRPDVEIYREFVAQAPPKALPANATPAYVITGSLVESHETDGKATFPDTWKPEDFQAHNGGEAAYIVRTRASKRRDSADSNVAVLTVHTPPPVISGVTATVSKEAITIAWQPAESAAAGAALSYRVYRQDLTPLPGPEAPRKPGAPKPKTEKEAQEAVLLGVAPASPYRDTNFEFGHSYVYAVRSVAGYQTGAVESADSEPVSITPRDTFPPALPTGLVALVVPATTGQPLHIELSWDISPEADLAGYYVYRSDEQGTPGRRLNQDLLLTPAFRDTNVGAGRAYFYTVTGVDRAGNESLPSAPASVIVTNEEKQP
jgi:hypothetical protein